MISQKGFSLMETVVYTAIIGSLITSFIAFSFSIQEVKNKSFVIQETQVNARIALDFISELIKNSEAVLGPEKGNQADVLVLDIPNTNDHTTISLSNGTIFYQSGSSPEQALTASSVFVDSIQFSNISENNSPNNIGITINIHYRNNDSGDFDYNYYLKTNVNTRI